MENKVIIISIDGMRPDGFLQCGSPFVSKLLEISSHALDAKTVFPSVTLPCHMSIFHSVDPSRHGITTNTFTQFARPVNGLFEQVRYAGGVSAMYYGWENLRDVSRPGSLKFASYINCYASEGTDGILTDLALERMRSDRPDLVFLYMVETDDKGGHDCGWMTPTYLGYVRRAVENVRRVYDEFGDEYTFIITADHGGHGRCHGEDIPEDMTVPVLFAGPRFECGKALENVTVLDIAPTAADVMRIPSAPEWEGKSLARKI